MSVHSRSLSYNSSSDNRSGSGVDSSKITVLSKAVSSLIVCSSRLTSISNSSIKALITKSRLLNQSVDQILKIFQQENESRNANVIVFNETNTSETWFCNVTPNDGYVDGNILNSSERYINNSLPSITSVTISPSQPGYETLLTCTPSGWYDLEDDPENYYYAWFDNSTLTSVTTNTYNCSSEDNCEIGDNVVLERALIAPDCKVSSESQIRDRWLDLGMQI